MQISDWRVGGEPQKTLSDAWIRMHPDEPNTLIFLFPRSVRVLFFLGYWRPCLTSVLSLFTTSSQLVLIWRELLQERICIQPLDERQAKRTSIADPGLTLIQCAVLMLNQCDWTRSEHRRVQSCCGHATMFALWLVPEIDYKYFTLL